MAGSYVLRRDFPGITTPYPFKDPARGGKSYDLSDGAIGKTIGRRRVMKELPIDTVVTVNPIVPYSGSLTTILDNLEATRNSE